MTPEVDDVKALKAELARLRVKRSETSDKDIRRALDERIGQIEAKLATEAAPSPEPELPEFTPESPTPEQIAEAEQLIRQARVEKMRGNTRGAGDLMKKAAEVAPGSPTVLEAFGDDLVERRQLAKARDVYKQAWKLDKKNVGLERKYATIVAQLDSAGSIEDQLRANLSDSPFISESEALASANAATIFSAILPGLGHVVLGRNVGYAIMAVWLVCSGWLLFMHEDVAQLFNFAAGHGSPNVTVLAPLFLMAVIYLGTLASLKSARRTHHKKVIEHPRPPVDLPFELDEKRK